MIDKNTSFIVHKQAWRKCKWCDKAVDLLEEKGYKISIQQHSLSDIKAKAEQAGMNTVPIIYHGVTLVGGYDDLVKYLGGDA